MKKEFGIEVDKRKIILKDPIKRLGVYIVQIRLYPHIEVLVEVHVLAG
ncbi:MAG: 50S ribosomal L9 C-terminal domain-containing protein [Desulfotomaculales bacterium]